MLTICSRWEASFLSPETEWRLWRQLRGAYKIDRFIFTPILPEMVGVNIEQYDTMSEALAACNPPLFFLEPQGEFTMSVLARAPDATLVLGSGATGNLDLAGDNPTVRIASAFPTDLYGINAAAIALAYRFGQ